LIQAPSRHEVRLEPCWKTPPHAASEEKVMFITVYSCKGLEFPLGVIPGAEHWQQGDDLIEQ
jgi:superfamily I DNA/RNA helicase